MITTLQIFPGRKKIRTAEEFENYFNIKSIGEEQHCSATNKRQSVKKSFEDVPSSWDWREHNGVSPVKN